MNLEITKNVFFEKSKFYKSCFIEEALFKKVNVIKKKKTYFVLIL